jgi:subtilisin family serine protease
MSGPFDLSVFSRRLLALASLALLTACAPDAMAPRTGARESTVPSRSSAKVSTPSTFSTSGRYLVGFGGQGMPADFTDHVTSLGGSVRFVHAASGFAIVDGLSAAGAAALARAGGVADVEGDVTTSVAPADGPHLAAMGDPGIASIADPTTAILFGWQWNMRDIGADRAWAAGDLGSSDVTVAILDTGIDYDAFDLNGLVDLSRSVSFSASDDALVAQYYPTRNPVTDLNGHGTNVATQVSSKAFAFAGVTSRTTLMAVKVLGADGSGTVGDILRGLLWAADHGANVANMSLGAAFAKSSAGGGQLVGLMNRVVTYAESRGVLIVASAGNEATDLDHDGNAYEAFCSAPQVMCVAAVGPASPTGSPDVPAYYTNFGRSSITVAAPGGNRGGNAIWPWGSGAWSWVWSLCSKDLTFFDADGSITGRPCASGGVVLGFAGTSQAAPHVAGLAALLMAQYPGRSAAWIKSRIAASADDLGQPGTDPFYGRGRIDVAAALGF